MYIYVGKPISEVKYRCKVVEDQIDDFQLYKNLYAIPKKVYHNYFSNRDEYIKLEFEYEYPYGTFMLESLRNHGFGQVQIQARTSRELQNIINSIERTMRNGGKR